jgi:hypothetical protein
MAFLIVCWIITVPHAASAQNGVQMLPPVGCSAAGNVLAYDGSGKNPIQCSPNINVTGSISVGNNPAACTAALAGAIRWNNSVKPPVFEGCDGIGPKWTSLGGDSGSLCGPGYVMNLGTFPPSCVPNPCIAPATWSTNQCVCPAGWTISGNFGNLQNVQNVSCQPNCPPSMPWNSTQNACEPPCGGGTFVNTICTCPPSLPVSSNGNCVAGGSSPSGSSCPGNQSPLGDGTCGCLEGAILNSQGDCNYPLIQSCPPGQMWNGSACVSSCPPGVTWNPNTGCSIIP